MMRTAFLEPQICFFIQGRLKAMIEK